MQQRIATAIFNYSRLLLVSIAMLAAMTLPASAASTAGEIDAKVDAALARLKAEVPGSDAVVANAKGILVFSGVIKAGFVIAGEGGEGALRIGGKTEGYYSIFSGSVGFQAGGQKRDIIMVFLDADALKDFQASDGWKIGADGTVTLIDTGASGTIDSATLKKPIVGFIVGQKGLMAGISLDGSKITKLER
ncbi:MAG: YSC84-related protein [Gammaproteobacteria bacterium]|nr:YSC84-related protein [Gammaproteobacteria bacterium]MDH5274797.1 YSC84-related protein [Gammaproteobacteria bacterium]